MRASSLLATLVIGVAVVTASVRASEPERKDTKTPVAKKDTKTPGAKKEPKPSAAVKGQEGAAKAAPATNAGAAAPAAQGARTAKLETAAAAAAAAAGAPRHGTVTGAATASAPKEETLEEIVARVKRRLAIEPTPKRNVSAPVATSAAAPSRVTLVWRPYVVWPDELTAAKPEASQPDADRDRVTLKWESDER
jgi:hypothetical protein